MQKNATAGMTLFELLIIVAIIGILTTILLPNLFGAKAKAYDTTSLSCANAVARTVLLYEMNEKKMVKIAKPTIAQLTAIDPGGMQDCTKISTTGGIFTLDYAQTTPGNAYVFTIKHPSGRSTFTVNEIGIFS